MTIKVEEYCEKMGFSLVHIKAGLKAQPALDGRTRAGIV